MIQLKIKKVKGKIKKELLWQDSPPFFFTFYFFYFFLFNSPSAAHSNLSSLRSKLPIPRFMGGTADSVKMGAMAAPAGAAPKPQAAGPAVAPQGGGVALRILKFFVALALIPGCVGLSLGIHDYFLTLSSRLNYAAMGPSAMQKYFVFGIGAFGVFAILLWRPVVLYVFGHELVHALATWMCLGKVTNLSASAKGGQVTTSKSNTFIRLAPYCVPLYVIGAVAVFLALNAWWRPLNAYTQWLAFAVGFFYAFHIGFTLWSLRRDQPDLKPDGWLFSLVLIYIGNLAVFVLLMGFICDGQIQAAWPALRDASQMGWKHAVQIYRNLTAMTQQVVNQ